MSRLKRALLGSVFNGPILVKIASWASRPGGQSAQDARSAKAEASA